MQERKSLADANNPVESVDNKAEVPVQEQKTEESKEIEAKSEPRKEEVKEEPRPEPKHEHHAEHIQESVPHKSSHKFRKFVNAVKAFKLKHIKEKLNHYWFEYSRVVHLTRRPTRSEYRELAIFVLVGTAIIGGIGFVVQIALQFI